MTEILHYEYTYRVFENLSTLGCLWLSVDDISRPYRYIFDIFDISACDFNAGWAAEKHIFLFNTLSPYTWQRAGGALLNFEIDQLWKYFTFKMKCPKYQYPREIREHNNKGDFWSPCWEWLKLQGVVTKRIEAWTNRRTWELRGDRKVTLPMNERHSLIIRIICYILNWDYID